MIRRYVYEALMRIFLDHFAISAAIRAVMTIMLVARRFFSLNVPLVLAIPIWTFIVVSAISIFLLLAIDFFSQGQGIGRLASIPLLLGTLPLLISFLVALFIFPR